MLYVGSVVFARTIYITLINYYLYIYIINMLLNMHHTL